MLCPGELTSTVEWKFENVVFRSVEVVAAEETTLSYEAGYLAQFCPTPLASPFPAEPQIITPFAQALFTICCV